MKKCSVCGTEFSGACCPNCGAWATGEKIALDLGLELVKYDGKESNVVIPDKINRIGDNAFCGNTNLSAVFLPESVTNIGECAFADCSGLSSVNLPEALTKIGCGAFSGCDGLRTVTIPHGVERIGKSAFAGCGSLTIYCEAAAKPEGWDSGWNSSRCPVVWDCKNEPADGSGYFYAVIDNLRYGLKNGKACVASQPVNTLSAIIPARVYHKNTAFGVTEIGNYAFRNCKSLTQASIPDSVESIGGSAFEGCVKLASLSLPDSVKRIGGFAFGGCVKLKSVSLGSGLESIGSSAFAECAKLASVTLPESLTGLGYAAFNGCKALGKVIIPAGVTEIGGYAFYKCAALTSIIFRGSVSQWQSIKKSGSWNACTGEFTVNCADGILDKHGHGLTD